MELQEPHRSARGVQARRGEAAPLFNAVCSGAMPAALRRSPTEHVAQVVGRLRKCRETRAGALTARAGDRNAAKVVSTRRAGARNVAQVGCTLRKCPKRCADCADTSRRLSSSDIAGLHAPQVGCNSRRVAARGFCLSPRTDGFSALSAAPRGAVLGRRQGLTGSYLDAQPV
jgi:hypothetical protein